MHEVELAPRSAATVHILQFSTIGLILGMIALCGTFLLPWMISLITPQEESLAKVATDVVLEVKERVKATVQGEEFVEKLKAPEQHTATEWYPILMLVLGSISLCLGIVGFILHENPRISFSTITVASVAIVFHYFLLLAAVLIFMFLVIVVLLVSNVDIPFLE